MKKKKNNNNESINRMVIGEYRTIFNLNKHGNNTHVYRMVDRH